MLKSLLRKVIGNELIDKCDELCLITKEVYKMVIEKEDSGSTLGSADLIYLEATKRVTSLEDNQIETRLDYQIVKKSNTLFSLSRKSICAIKDSSTQLMKGFNNRLKKNKKIYRFISKNWKIIKSTIETLKDYTLYIIQYTLRTIEQNDSAIKETISYSESKAKEAYIANEKIVKEYFWIKYDMLKKYFFSVSCFVYYGKNKSIDLAQVVRDYLDDIFMDRREQESILLESDEYIEDVGVMSEPTNHTEND